MDYYLMLEGTVYGPYTLSDMRSFQLEWDTPVHGSLWPSDKWVRASELPELRGSFSNPQTTAVVSPAPQVVVQQPQVTRVSIPQSPNYAQQASGSMTSDRRYGVKPRSIGLIILFSIITLGIYFLYWFVVLTNDTNRLAGEKYSTDGVVALLLDIITLGIYGLFWCYKLGEKTDVINNNPNGGSKVLFLILSLFGFGWVGMLIAQDAVNKAVSR